MAMQLLAIIKILDHLKFGQYSEVHKFACVYLKIPSNHYVPSETNNNFENSYLKALILNKNNFFYNNPIKFGSQVKRYLYFG